jgi:hypothetical protein
MKRRAGGDSGRTCHCNATRTWPADSGPLWDPRVRSARLDGPREDRAAQDSSKCTVLINIRQCRAKDCALFGRSKDVGRLKLDFRRGSGQLLGMGRGQASAQTSMLSNDSKGSYGSCYGSSDRISSGGASGLRANTQRNRLARRGAASGACAGPDGIGEVLSARADRSATDNTK